MMVDVSDLMEILEAFMTSRGSRDLRVLLQGPIEELTWKTAPRLGLLLEHSNLAHALVAKVLCGDMQSSSIVHIPQSSMVMYTLTFPDQFVYIIVRRRTASCRTRSC